MRMSKGMGLVVLLLGALLTSSLFTLDVEAKHIGNGAMAPNNKCDRKKGKQCPLPGASNPPTRGCSPITRCRGPPSF
ncbi:unnamed protein product [Lupinus luteus]|uniref:Rapid ALkalinization Factor n=1 Tax=Lupinus luteus TaxID=3873 RepID=A0AAV1W6H3_LUPLU